MCTCVCGSVSFYIWVSLSASLSLSVCGVCVWVRLYSLQRKELAEVHDPAYAWSRWQSHIPGRSLLTIALVAFSHPWFKLFSQLKWITSDLVQITGICRTSSRKHSAKCPCTSIRQAAEFFWEQARGPSDSEHLWFRASLSIVKESESITWEVSHFQGWRVVVFNLSIDLQSWWVIIVWKNQFSTRMSITEAEWVVCGFPHRTREHQIANGKLKLPTALSQSWRRRLCVCSAFLW